MLSSVGIQACSCNRSQFPAKPSKIETRIAPKPPNSYPIKRKSKTLTISSSSSLTQDAAATRDEQREKMKVVVKPIERPRLVLRFVWMDKNIGIAIDQLIPGGRGTIPVSPYYFWPRKDAWEELKLMMEAKPWISNQQKVFLLNQATDIINLWQETGHG